MSAPQAKAARALDSVPVPPDLVVRLVRTAAGDELLVASFRLPAGAAAPLTAAECEIATALLSGRRYAEIAAERGTSRHTVAKQVSLLLRKLGVASRFELVARAPLLFPAPPDA